MDSRNSLHWIVGEAERLGNGAPVGRKSWSLAQICEHLALAIEGTARHAVPAAPGAWTGLTTMQRFKRRLMKLALLTTGRFPENVPAPPSVLPILALPLPEALDRLRAAARAFETKLAQPDATWVLHPLLGPMTGRQWRRFHLIHARHHFSFLSPRPPAASDRSDPRG